MRPAGRSIRWWVTVGTPLGRVAVGATGRRVPAHGRRRHAGNEIPRVPEGDA